MSSFEFLSADSVYIGPYDIYKLILHVSLVVKLSTPTRLNSSLILQLFFLRSGVSSVSLVVFGLPVQPP